MSDPSSTIKTFIASNARIRIALLWGEVPRHWEMEHGHLEGKNLFRIPESMSEKKETLS